MSKLRYWVNRSSGFWLIHFSKWTSTLQFSWKQLIFWITHFKVCINDRTKIKINLFMVFTEATTLMDSKILKLNENVIRSTTTMIVWIICFIAHLLIEPRLKTYLNVQFQFKKRRISTLFQFEKQEFQHYFNLKKRRISALFQFKKRRISTLFQFEKQRISTLADVVSLSSVPHEKRREKS